MSTIDERGYWDKQATQRAEDEATRNQPVSLAQRHTYLLNAISSCGTDSMLAEKAAALRVELAAVEAEIAAKRAAEWTLEVTMQRRAEWNARVKAGEFTTRGQIDGIKVRNAEREQGWYVVGLKDAVKRHNL